LTDNGIPSMAELNRRLEDAVRAHRRVLGYTPSPGFAFDLVRVDLTEEGYARMLSAPTSKGRMTLRRAVREAKRGLGDREFGPTLGVPQRVYGPTAGGITGAELTRKTGPVAEWERQILDQLNHTSDPFQVEHLKAQLAAGPPPHIVMAGLETAGIYEGNGINLFFSQIRDAITGIDDGIVLGATALGLDIRDIGSEIVRRSGIPGAFGIDMKDRDITPSRTIDLGKGIVEATKEMFRNPTEHPGDIFLLGLGLLPLPPAMLARVGSAGRALVLGAETVAGAPRLGRVGAATKALVTRPNPGVFEYGLGAYRAQLAYSENMLWRVLVQEPRWRSKQEKLVRRYGPDGDAMTYGDLRRTMSWLFSPERKVRTATLRRMRTEFELRMQPFFEMDRLNRWNVKATTVVNDLIAGGGRFAVLAKARNRVGIEKAIQVLASGLSVDDWRRFHERMLTLADQVETAPEGMTVREVRQARRAIADAHRAQLQALDEAEEILANRDRPIGRAVLPANRTDRGAPTFDDLFAAARRMMENGERLKRLYFGFDDEDAIWRLGALSAVIRGDVDPSDLRQVFREGKLRDRQKRIVEELEEAERRLAEAVAKRDRERIMLDVDYVPVRRGMTEQEARARLAHLLEQLDEFERRLYELKRTDIYGSAEVMRAEQARMNRQSARRRARQTKTSDIVWRAVDKEIRRIRAMDTTDPTVVKFQQMMDEIDMLSRAFASREARLSDLFDDEPSPTIQPFPETDDIDVVPVRGTDEELIAAGKKRVESLERRLRDDGLAPKERQILAVELARERRDLAALGVDGRVEAAQRRVNSLRYRLLKVEEGLSHNERVRETVMGIGQRVREEGGFYIPVQSAVSSKRSTIRSARATVSTYGIRAGDTNLPELEHHFTGEAVVVGDYRIDATGLSAASYQRTVRAVTLMEERKAMWDIAQKFPGYVPEGFVPIRKLDDIPDDLRRLVADIDNGTLRASVADKIGDRDLDRLSHYLFPRTVDRRGKAIPVDIDGKTPLSGDDVRIVDERMMLERHRFWVPGLRGVGSTPRDFWDVLDQAGTIMGYPLNEPFRVLNLFLRPAYILNALGAGMQTVIQQGFVAPVNLFRAVRASDVYGKDAAQMLDQLSGQTRAASYVTERAGRLSTASEALYRFWQPLTDLFFRRSAMIYELRRVGIVERGDVRRALGLEGEVPAELRAKVAEASHRAKRAMIDFGLSPFEKAVARHIFFVYAFLSRSALWGLHTMIDHPTQTATYAFLGQMAAEELDREIGETVPLWMDRAGYFYSGRDEEGRPYVRDWRQLSTYMTIADMANAGMSLFRPVPYQSMEEYLGGAGAFWLPLITGRDEYGQPLEGGLVSSAASLWWRQTSLGALLERRERAGELQDIPPADPLSMGIRESISQDTNPFLATERGHIENPVFLPLHFEQQWGPFLAGGLARRIVDEQAARARYWRDQPEGERRRHELELLMRTLRAQAKFLGLKRIPDEMKLAVRVAFRVDNARDDYSRREGVAPTLYEDSRIWIGSLRNEGVITKEEQARLTDELRTIRDDREQLELFLAKLKWRAHDGALTRWDEDVRELQKVVNPQALRDAKSKLERLGLDAGDLTMLDDRERLEYGRLYLRYLHELERRREASRGTIGDDYGVAAAEMRALEAEFDRPTKIGGKTVPSPVRLYFALKPPADQRRVILQSVAEPRSGYPRSWEHLSQLEKELLGRPVPDSVQAGWAELERLAAEWRDRNPGKRLYREDLRKIARALNRESRYRGLLADFDFASRTPLRRFENLSVYRNSEHRARWEEILTVARQFETAMNSGRYTKTYVRDKWEEYVKSYVQPWLKTQPQSFQDEVESYGANFVAKLLGGF
jgi:hypothetical protein